MYAVVEWVDGGSVSVVVGTWIVDEDGVKYCYWPPASMKAGIRQKAVVKKVAPDETWEKEQVIVKRFEGI